MSVEYEVNIDKSYSNKDCIDEWGVASLWDNNIGVEYNYCIDNGLNCSAIYLMEYNTDTDYWETDYSIFTHYEIEWNEPNWETLLVNNMLKTLNNMIK